MKIRYNSWVFKILPKWINGIVLYPYIHFQRSKDEVSEKLFRHELEHIYQIQRDGFFKFYITYIYYNITKGYKNNPYEIEAKQKALLPLTEEELELYRGF